MRDQHVVPTGLYNTSQGEIFMTYKGTNEADLKKVKNLVGKIWALIDDNSGLSNKVVFVSLISTFDKLLDSLDDDDYATYTMAMVAMIDSHHRSRGE
jgi:hypothetical protein